MYVFFCRFRFGNLAWKQKWQILCLSFWSLKNPSIENCTILHDRIKPIVTFRMTITEMYISSIIMVIKTSILENEYL